MMKRSLFFVLVAALVLSGCSAGLTNTVIPIKIARVDGGDNTIYTGDEIQFTVSPLGPKDSVVWEVHDSSHPDRPCASPGANPGYFTGDGECSAVSIVALSSSGAEDSFQLTIMPREKDPIIKQ